MKYSSGTKELNLPSYYQFGVELEAFNVNTSILGNSLYHSKESIDFLKQRKWETVSVLKESLVSEGGAECVSPILHDKKEDWKNLEEVCEHMKKYPGKYGDKVIADEKCGCHVHFDAKVLQGKNRQETENITTEFLRLWAEAEELIYKMCNEKGNPIREGSINLKQKGLNLLVCRLQRIQGMASPMGKKIMKSIEKNTLKVSHKKMGILKRAISAGKLDPRRYHGLNLTNIGNPRKNTIEFRTSNGTLEPETIKQNVYFYASILEAARTMALNPEKIQEKKEQFYKTDITEQQKAENFLNVLFEDENDRKIYMERWESVRNAPVFNQNDKKGFAQGRFQRESFHAITRRTPASQVKEAWKAIQDIMIKQKNQNLNNKMEEIIER